MAWGLADELKTTAYLDCIPDAVRSFEETVSRLPGFEQRGTVTRLVVDDAITQAHVDKLVWTVMQLMSAEKVAP